MRLTQWKLVGESSACLQGFPRHGLDATHSGMNKFESPDSADFKLVKETLVKFASNAAEVLSVRKTRKEAEVA